MKRVVKLCGIFGALAMLLSLPLSAKAAPYNYRVRIYAGAQGTFADGSTVKEYTGDENGCVSVNFDWEEEVVLPEDTKYYAKGIKESGSEEMGKASFMLTEDRDYVVVYGVRHENMVKYTINYVDEAGNTLADSKNYEGNIGDMPIVGHLPIEGYVPQAYNLTRTLQAEEEKNIFTFVYRRAETASTSTGGGTTREEVVTTTNTETVVIPGTGTNEEIDGGVTVIEGDTTAAEAAGADEDAGMAGADDGAEAVGDDDAGEAAEPRELINLDDEEIPLAGPGGGKDKLPENALGTVGLLHIPPAVMVGLASTVMLILAGGYILIAKQKKKKANEGTDEDA